MAVYKNDEFIKRLKDIQASKTIYCSGMWGQEIAESIIATKAKQYPNWYTAERQAKLRRLIGQGYHGFDCVCLIKSVLWGYLNQKYASNGVPDFGADSIMNYCTNVSSDMSASNIQAGEALWMKGHVGIYIGNGKVVECTSAWTSNVLISNLSARKWLKHGKLKWIDYSNSSTNTSTSKTTSTTTSSTIKVGSKVKLNKGAKWVNDKTPSSWVYNTTLYVTKISGDKATTSRISATGAVTGTAYTKDLTLI